MYAHNLFEQLKFCVSFYVSILIDFAPQATHDGSNLEQVVLLFAAEPPEERRPVLHKVGDVLVQQLAQVHVEMGPEKHKHCKKYYVLGFQNS